MIGRVRKMLRFHAKAAAEFVDPSTLAQDRTVEKVSTVELQSGFCRQNLQHASAVRLEHRGHYTEFARLFVDHPIMVVAIAELQLLVVRVNARTDGGRCTKIERRALYRAQLAIRDQGAIHGCEARSIDLHHVTEI